MGGKQAALAYDLAALKFRGPDAATNYDTANYVQELLQFNDVRAPAFPGGHMPAKVHYDMAARYPHGGVVHVAGAAGRWRSLCFSCMPFR